MNYRQLEEEINKWSVELQEQEKIFIQQATQVNAWDRLLIDNGEKVASCHMRSSAALVAYMFLQLVLYHLRLVTVYLIIHW